MHARRRPWRDRAIVFVLLSTGLRHEELVRLKLDQVQPHTASALRAARRATVTGVQGKGESQRAVVLSADAPTALADYLERERPEDARDRAMVIVVHLVSVPAARMERMA